MTLRVGLLRRGARKGLGVCAESFLRARVWKPWGKIPCEGTLPTKAAPMGEGGRNRTNQVCVYGFYGGARESEDAEDPSARTTRVVFLLLGTCVWGPRGGIRA